VTNRFPEKTTILALPVVPWIQASRSGRLPNGFSLVELLVVMAILAILMSLSAPAFSNLGEGRGVEYAARRVELTLEQAQARAVASKLYVWVVFGVTNHEGRTSTAVTVLADPRGFSSPPKPATRNDYSVLSKPEILKGVVIQDVPGEDLVENSGSFGVYESTIGGTSWSMPYMIRFGPAGDVQIAPGRIPRTLEVGLTSYLDSLRSTKKNMTAAVRVGGISGTVDMRWLDTGL